MRQKNIPLWSALLLLSLLWACKSAPPEPGPPQLNFDEPHKARGSSLDLVTEHNGQIVALGYHQEERVLIRRGGRDTDWSFPQQVRLLYGDPYAWSQGTLVSSGDRLMVISADNGKLVVTASDDDGLTWKTEKTSVALKGGKWSDFRHVQASGKHVVALQGVDGREVSGVVSRDGGRNWTRIQEELPKVKGYEEWQLADISLGLGNASQMTVAGDGSLHLLFGDAVLRYSDKEMKGWYTCRSKDGTSFEPAHFEEGEYPVFAVALGSNLERPESVYRCHVKESLADDGLAEKEMRTVQVSVSDDGGAEWGDDIPIATSANPLGQPQIAGKGFLVVCSWRDQKENTLWYSASGDAGRTWSPAQEVGESDYQHELLLHTRGAALLRERKSGSRDPHGLLVSWGSKL